ncbi:MAG: sigma-70 family RNA polymerase sigma factor [Verrucomicrobiales bacterium]|nr:sigma-70 family RNA polymerase sigma factor [Verrucomicrobiales bacterium]
MSSPQPVDPAAPGAIAEDLFRRESGRLVSVLTGHLGVHRLQLAEDVVQEALVRALQTWPYRGVPDNPAAWLTQTAKHLALDQLRRERNWQEKEPGIAAEHARWLASPTPDTRAPETFADDTLRMLFVCFHPRLSVEAQTALALRTLCGLSPAEIAGAFLTSEAAIAKRLVRARQRIRDLNLPFSVPGPADLPKRLDGVLATLYLLFNEGYKASTGERLVREDLCHEAIRLARLLADHPATRQPKTHALIALMMLNAARLPARTDVSGALRRLREQDRGLWNPTLIRGGLEHLALSATGDALSEYHLEAGIAACHSTAPDDASTDWARVLSLYDQLAARSRSPVVALNRAVAVARVHGPAEGIKAIDRIPNRERLEDYHLYHAVRGALEAELGHAEEALRRYRKAESLATHPSERAFLAARIRECRDGNTQ